MDFIHIIVLVNGAYFIYAANIDKNGQGIEEKLNALTKQLSYIEDQNAKLQEKTLTLEAALLHQQEEFEKAKDGYKVEIQDLRHQLNDEKSWKTVVEKSLERNSESLVNLSKAISLTDGVSTNKRQSEHENPVAFYAGLSNLATYNYGDSIIFDNVSLNLGYHYMPSFGLFRAPFNGIYIFSVTLMAHMMTDTHAAIYINDQPRTWMKLYGQEHEYDTISQTAVYHLDQGDAVTVKHTESNKTFHGHYTYFSGFLLKEMFTSTSIIGK